MVYASVGGKGAEQRNSVLATRVQYVINANRERPVSLGVLFDKVDLAELSNYFNKASIGALG